jgi:hypothetical protein
MNFSVVLGKTHHGMGLQTDIFANEDGTIPEADTAAASLLAQHDPSTVMPKNVPMAGPDLQQQMFGGYPGAHAPGPQQVPIAMHPGTQEAGTPVPTIQGGLLQPQYPQYGHYAAWPGMHPGVTQQMIPDCGVDPTMQVCTPV